ncbi:hypothetical protein [Actinomyces trachealis]|uniref:hypothetical protein n=1 Tax=Actinomyces trachealis TaxID=2763540 RepID=UPI0018C8384D|nr:hypothetical protein [Actinomyces trachealis]
MIAVVAVLAVVVVMSGVFRSNTASPTSPEQTTAPQAGATDGVQSADRFIISYKQDSQAAKAISQSRLTGRTSSTPCPQR